MSRVSVVIPCYNQGQYLEEAVQSVLAQTYTDIEIIIVDDGSTDSDTLAALDRCLPDDASDRVSYLRDGIMITVLRQENQGVCRARNAGISQAVGEYILPLDADDMIDSRYLQEAVPVLDLHPDVGIVYCEARYFGEFEGRVPLPPFETAEMLSHNIIFNSALFRRKDWEEVGGYNPNMVYGWEDWDFWLSVLELKRTVYRIPKVLFFYRIKSVKKLTRNAMQDEERFFMRLHTILNHEQLYRNTVELRMTFQFAQLYYDTGLGFHEGQVLTRVILGDEWRLEFVLPENVGTFLRFRFDPLTTYCIIRLQKITLVTQSGTRIDIPELQSNGHVTADGQYFFDTSDPWIEFSVNHVVEPVSQVIVSLEYSAVGSDALPLLAASCRRRLQEALAEQARLEREYREALVAKEHTITAQQHTLQQIQDSRLWKVRSLLRRIQRGR